MKIPHQNLRSVLVPVVAVTSVQMSVVQIVDVVTVGNRSVSAVGPVFVVVLGVSDARIGRALVPVIVVLMMTVPVVDVVDVIVVDHRHMAAIGPVHVRMFVVSMGLAHEHSLAFVAKSVWNGDVTSFADRLLDASIVGGFSRLGYALRSRQSSWESLPPDSLAGQRVVVTGPTSGIGRAAAERVAALGATVVLVGRDAERTGRVADALGGDHEVVVCDVSDLESVAESCAAITSSGIPDVVVHNAGALLHEAVRTPQGFETTMALHVLAPHLVTRLIAAPRSIWVASGGMYGASLVDPRRRDPMTPSKYDGTRQYASAKRVQVALVQEWATREPDRFVAVMHPGWADTPGVRTSLPGFAKVTAPILRSADEGADTIAWLSATRRDLPSGEFWCDREVRPRHRLPSTKKSDTEDRRAAVFAWADELTDPWT